MEIEKHLVNASALQDCRLICQGKECRLLDISFLRAVIEFTDINLESGIDVNVEFQLDRYRFSANMVIQSRGENFIRLGFSRLLPSARATLRAFLSAKKVGESLKEDWASENCRHFHGLNESEFWVGSQGEMMISFLDQLDTQLQFVVHISESTGVRAGKISRTDYMALENIGRDLPLVASYVDRDFYLKLGESRDIVTNFRPLTRADYSVKQGLLKVLSDNLYSSSHRMERLPPRSHRPIPPVPLHT